MASFQKTLRKLAIFYEGFVKAGWGLDLAKTWSLGPKTAALLQVGYRWPGKAGWSRPLPDNTVASAPVKRPLISHDN